MKKTRQSHRTSLWRKILKILSETRILKSSTTYTRPRRKDSAPQLTTALVSENQEDIEVLEGMVIEKRLPDLLSLLESHARAIVPKVLVIPKPLTPIPVAPAQTELADKKRIMDKRGGKRVVKEGEVQEETPHEPIKMTKVTRTQQRKCVESSGTASE